LLLELVIKVHNMQGEGLDSRCQGAGYHKKITSLKNWKVK